MVEEVLHLNWLENLLLFCLVILVHFLTALLQHLLDFLVDFFLSCGQECFKQFPGVFILLGNYPEFCRHVGTML